MRRNFIRSLLVLVPLVWFVWLPPRQEAIQPQSKGVFEASVLPFLEENCTFCHSAAKQSGGLDLSVLKTVDSLARQREKWDMVLQKIESGEMPPKGLPRPDPARAREVTKWLSAEFARADRLAKPDPGRVTARRLNRAEYNNTVRDLLGVDLNPAADFPQDDSGYGFDNIGDVLSLSPALMEKYIATAEKLARTAIFGPDVLSPTLVRLQSPGRKVIPSKTPLREYDLTGLSLPNAFHATHRFPVDGEYIVRIFFGGNRPAASEPLQLALWIDGEQVKTIEFDPEHLASFEIDRQELGGKVTEMRARIPAGEHWVAVSLMNLYDGLPPRYNGPNPSKRPEPPPLEFKPRPGFPPERIAEFKKRFEERRKEVAEMPVNEARIGTIEIGGPYNQTKGPSPESLKRIFTCGHEPGTHTDACATKIVGDLARRAYRRPVTSQEVERLSGLVALAKKQGDSFEEGICLAVQAMLISPHFLFRIEFGAQTGRTDDATPIGDYEMASRLSYFLWSSMPDEALLQAAAQGRLRKPEGLAAEVRRMVRDPKSRALVENFAGQWLELRKLESVKPDTDRFPDFEEYLRLSMRRETELFFGSILREDRSLVDFLDADYTFLNERLARFYQIPGVKGPAFQKVSLAGNAQRGGLLTQASVLTVSSYATRTSPVLRGKWILENILNQPPPPAPPGVPNLDDSKVGSAASLRQQLEEHRKNATCASCHSRMDPLGFGLENYDAIGNWRTKDGNFPIDSAGVLPDGRSFQGPAALKGILKSDRNAFAECMTEKMLTYALGRGLERYDKPVVKSIAKNVATADYRFSQLLIEIVNSLPFQKRRAL